MSNETLIHALKHMTFVVETVHNLAAPLLTPSAVEELKKNVEWAQGVIEQAELDAAL